MTTDIERQFFETFGIEAKEEKYCYWECKKPELENVACNNTECEHYRHKIHYPQITDKQYLQLVCWVNERRIFQNFDVDGLKEYVLKELCTMVVKEQFKTEVQSLFKEG